MSLSSERCVDPNVDANSIPKVVLPEHVRFRQRKSVFVGTTWRFDFTLTWSGPDRDSCEKNQTTEPPEYEVECEILDRSYCINRMSTHVALSMLLKVRDIIGPGFDKWIPISK